jgi:putative flippase GtrA
MKQTKLVDFKYSKPNLFNSLLVYRRTSFIYKVYYWLLDFGLFYRNKKTLKYSVIGISGEIIDFSILMLFTEIFHIYYLLSALFSYLIALTNNFLLNLNFTFKYKPLNTLDFISSMINYFIVSLFGLLFSLFLMGLLVEVFHMYYLFAKLISSGFIFILMYTGHNFVLGKKEIKLHK